MLRIRDIYICVCVYMYIYIYIFPGDSDGKESACNVGDPDLICIYMQKKYHKQEKKTQKQWQVGPGHATNLPGCASSL